MPAFRAFDLDFNIEFFILIIKNFNYIISDEAINQSGSAAGNSTGCLALKSMLNLLRKLRHLRTFNAEFKV
jgi:hypothetical protein